MSNLLNHVEMILSEFAIFCIRAKIIKNRKTRQESETNYKSILTHLGIEITCAQLLNS